MRMVDMGLIVVLLEFQDDLIVASERLDLGVLVTCC
jgi:hypothetical protein